MGKLTVLALRVVIAIGLAGSLFVQTVMVPLLWADLDEAPAGVRTSLVVIVVLGIVTMQVTAVCVWRLLTMVRRGTVFSHAAFRYVDIVIGAIATASALTFAMAVTLAPGEAVAPGIVLLVCGASLVVAGVALVVLVLRMLLAQAVARDAEAHDLRAELNEVI
jgi:NhaP-type Na+/H+ or K+/H+ antiporter